MVGSTTPQSRDALSRLTTDEWARWLKEEVSAWSVEPRGRISPPPFFPLVIAPDETDPGAALASEITLTCGGRIQAPAQAACRLIKNWEPFMTGVEGLDLLLNAAMQLGASNLFAAVLGMLEKVTPGTRLEMDRLGLSVTGALGLNLHIGQLSALATALARADIYSPIVAADLVAAQCRLDVRAAGHFLAMSPLKNLDARGRALQWLVGRLVEDFSPGRLEATWLETPMPNKDRRALLGALQHLAEESVPPPDPPKPGQVHLGALEAEESAPPQAPPEGAPEPSPRQEDRAREDDADGAEGLQVGAELAPPFLVEPGPIADEPRTLH